MIDYKMTKKECKSLRYENSGLLKRLLYIKLVIYICFIYGFLCIFNILYGFKNVIFLHWFIFFNFVN